jgi:hypothetical protein
VKLGFAAAKRAARRVDLRVERLVVDRLPDQPPSAALSRRQRLGGQRQAERPRLADQAGQHPGAAAVGDQADRGEGLDEFRRSGGDHDVAGERDIGAGAGGDAVDPGDDRQGEAVSLRISGL